MENLTFKTIAFTVIGVALTCWMAVILESNKSANVESQIETIRAEAFKAGWKAGNNSTSDYSEEVHPDMWNRNDLVVLMKLDSAKYCDGFKEIN